MPKVNQGVTLERVRELLDYDRASGQFRWRAHRSSRVRAGSLAGNVSQYGYRQICIDGKSYRAHRLVWLWETGQWAPEMLDHANGQRDDNRFGNLRTCSQSQNLQNKRSKRGSTSKYTGVSFDKARGKWLASIKPPGGKLIGIGRFGTEGEAASAYAAAKAKYHTFNPEVVVR